ncbi:MAG: ATP-binding protein, partial [Candidatus Marinamargulisbacteria bacterium]
LAKKACVFSMIGRHPLLFIGSPGIGKTMLIDRMPSLFQPLTNQQALDNCCMEILINDHMNYHATPPYRAPHHSISYAGMIGGKNPPQPGEITRANHGILFLDEMGEYQRAILDTLREPLETKEIKLSRAGNSATFPADFLLVAAMNPCYCGYYFDPLHACQCLSSQLQRYWQKISQPFLDRISICCILAKPTVSLPTLSHQDMLTMVKSGVNMSKKRNPEGVANHQLSIKFIYETSQIPTKTQSLLDPFFKQHQCSMRGKKRILQLARTIADAFNDTTIQPAHASLAIQLTQHHQLPLNRTMQARHLAPS